MGWPNRSNLPSGTVVVRREGRKLPDPGRAMSSDPAGGMAQTRIEADAGVIAA
ncbi:hypothetical protein KV697_13400 [Sphingomonas sanguinis]|uniref:hypothetical protein n=1 Tax=Sphingomonas sanguinis TaxID=33051 RepID=UPI001C5A0FB5|nr:hypothetical protein [Sphingomonas sanguinis]QXT34777.1 hypothetical protein KV697_13400 [Sphingomonas sanguinis]